MLASSRYSYAGNGFKTLVPDNGNQLRIDDGKLMLEGNGVNNCILMDTTALPCNYRYTVKMACVNNATRKISLHNQSNRINNKTWGIAFDITPDGEMYTVEFRSGSIDIHDDTDNKPFAIVELNHHVKQVTTTVASVRIDKPYLTDNKENTIAINVENNNVTVWAGREKMDIVLEAKLDNRILPGNHVGLYAGSEAKLEIDRTALQFTPDSRIVSPTRWNMDSLREHFAQSSDPVEGLWVYLDRDMDDKWTKMGGRYMLAVVRNGDSYDIIYCDGAQVMKQDWKPFLIKGKMTPTMFSGVYNGMWIDSTFQPITEDVQITIENGVVMAVNFPVLKSQLRFSKVVEQ